MRSLFILLTQNDNPFGALWPPMVRKVVKPFFGVEFSSCGHNIRRMLALTLGVILCSRRSLQCSPHHRSKISQTNCCVWHKRNGNRSFEIPFLIGEITGNLGSSFELAIHTIIIWLNIVLASFSGWFVANFAYVLSRTATEP